MSKKILDHSSVKRNYRFLAILLTAMVAGALLGWFKPAWGHNIAFLGKVFINMMFCIVVPLVFASIAGSIAGMESRHRAGKIMGTTVATFVITGAIAAVIMFVLMKLFPPVLVPWSDLASEEMGEYATLTEMIVNFFTAEDFVGLLSRRAMLPLIVAAIIFGFAVQWAGGADTPVAKLLSSLTDCMLKAVKIITYYAPIGFFGFFDLLLFLASHFSGQNPRHRQRGLGGHGGGIGQGSGQARLGIEYGHGGVNAHGDSPGVLQNALI